LEKETSHFGTVMLILGQREEMCDKQVKTSKEGLYTPSQHALVNSAAKGKDINPFGLFSFLPFCNDMRGL
jgi:hypothetical protein